MRTKIFLIAVALLALLGFSSCSNENEVLDQKKDTENLNETFVSFSIALPNGAPVTYAIHDQEEWNIAKLYLYEFDEHGLLVEDPVDIKPNLTSNNAGNYTYKKAIPVKNRNVRQFVFVANEEVAGITKKTSTIAELKAKLASKTLTANASSKGLLNEFSGKNCIPMTGYGKQKGNDLIAITGAPADVTVDMTRIVARIDIENKVPNLIVTDVKLKSANSHSYLFEQDAYTAITANTKVSGITPFAVKPATFDNGKKMPKAFYLYENGEPVTDEKDALRVEVTGKLGNRDVFYSIPFWKDGKEVAVKRNHLYNLVLGDGKTEVEPGTMVTFTIKDTPWNEIHMDQPFFAIAASYTSTSVGNYDEKTKTLSVDKTEHNDIMFNVSTEFTGHTAFTAKVTDTPDWVTASFSTSTLTITTKENTTGKPREASVVITSNAEPTTKLIIKVKQAE